MKAPEFPSDAPFSDQQQAWLTGFVAGLSTQLAQLAADNPNLKTEQANQPALHVLFGSQSGNAELVAEEASAMASGMGFKTTLSDLNATSMAELEQIEQAIFVVSTHGEGEMPDNAELFWEALAATTAPRLDQLKFGVLGLGDTSYDEFCQAAKILDTRLEQLGASRLTARQDCDVDYEDLADAWIAGVLPLLQDEPAAAAASTQTSEPLAKKKKSQWSKKNPFVSELLENRLLSGANSKKEVRHYALNLAESGLTYTPGDALNVVPENHPDLVTALLNQVGFSASTEITDHDAPLGALLTSQFEIVTPSKELIAEITARSTDSELRSLESSGDKRAKDAFFWGKDCLDLLGIELQQRLTVDEFVALLKPLQHRAYSISSSQRVHENEVHMTIAAVRWMENDRQHRGVASTWLADALQLGAHSPIFITQNNNFRVPEDDHAPMIMVGPGTGIAPFRAFLQEREACGAGGKNWLFFGDQHEQSDFLYREELTDWLGRGVLHKLDLAFSRDQQEKIYVQNRMLENSRDLYQWLEDGAYFYVCGDADRMAPDVEDALLQIIAKESGKDLDTAMEYLKTLKLEKRYLRDVY